MAQGPRRLSAHRLALALALVAAGPPLVIHNGWPGLLVAVAGTVYAVYLLLGKQWSRRRHPAPGPPRPSALLSGVARRLGERLEGFERERYVFRRFNEAGDALIADLQPRPSGFAVRVGFLLAPYWRWEQHEFGHPPQKRPDMSHVNWVQQVTPASSPDWVITDASEISAVVDDVVRAFPDLSLWLDRDLLWRASTDSSTELGHISESLRLWLLVERGQSEELRDLLDNDETDRDIWEYAKRQSE